MSILTSKTWSRRATSSRNTCAWIPRAAWRHPSNRSSRRWTKLRRRTRTRSILDCACGCASRPSQPKRVIMPGMAAFDPAVAVDVAASPAQPASSYCDQLERGKVIFFSDVPFAFPDEDRKFLLAQKQTGSRFHKNISYRPASDALNGVSPGSPDRERMHRVMREFSAASAHFVE